MQRIGKGQGLVFFFFGGGRGFIKKENYQIYCPKEILQQANKYRLVFLLNTKTRILFLWQLNGLNGNNLCGMLPTRYFQWKIAFPLKSRRDFSSVMNVAKWPLSYREMLTDFPEPLFFPDHKSSETIFLFSTCLHALSLCLLPSQISFPRVQYVFKARSQKAKIGVVKWRHLELALGLAFWIHHVCIKSFHCNSE